MDIGVLEKRFEEIYGTKVEHLYFAPGRVNLIGEHIDYNGGRVFPCALSFGTYLAVARRDDRRRKRRIKGFRIWVNKFQRGAGCRPALFL